MLCLGLRWSPENFWGSTPIGILYDFLFSHFFLLFFVISMLLRPYRTIFVAGVGPKKIFVVYTFRLINFIL